MAPVFRFRKARFLDRFTVPAEDRKVRGLVKVWVGYDCICARPLCGTNYRITARGTVNLAEGPKPVRSPAPVRPTVDDEEPSSEMPFTLDEDMVLPGGPRRR
jgi:hypothetical protein